MRRKYDIRNKRNFVIILIISIIIIVVFSLFVYKYKQAGKIEYRIKTGSILQDNKKNFINIDEDATLKVRWNGNYYLIYQGSKTGLGKKVMVFDTINGTMKLYGRFHEIRENGKVVLNEDETVLNNTSDNRFYKLDDREYLLVDRVISSNDNSINASNYLLVELDRMGNAKLSNYKLNLKTINPTILLTSKYSFDIANEILKYNDLDIDLKKIIGTTNEYKPDPDEEGGGEGEGEGEGEGQGQGGETNANGAGNNQTVIDEGTGQGGEEANVEEIIAKTKTTSIIRVSEGLTQIDIDYVVFDPYKEYKNVYATIVKNGVAENIELSPVNTHMIINGLSPDTTYNVKFYYTTIDKDTKETIITKFEEVNMKTKKPEYSVSVYKISGIKKTVTYKVYLEQGYEISKINMSYSFKHKVVDDNGNETVRDEKLTKTIDVSAGDKVITDAFSISGYQLVSDSIMRINIDSVVGTGGTTRIDSYTTFRVGG